MDNKNNIILFDIDRTLLDTDLFVKRLSHMVSKHSKKSIEEINIESLGLTYNFDFLTFLDRLSVSKNQYDLIKKEYEENEYIFPKYPDVIPVLKYLKGNNYSVGIFSEGTPRFQKNKLKNLKIDEYLEPKYVFIFQFKRNDEATKKIPVGSSIVDDKIEVIRYLEEKENFQPILLDRKKDQKEKAKYKTINTLIELKDILI